jgi:predicted esterase
MNVLRTVLIGITGCALALVLAAQIMNPKAARTAPVTHQGTTVEIRPGTLLERRRGFLTPAIPDKFDYTPSAEIARQSTRYQSDGLSWHALVPPGDAAAPVVMLLHGANRDGLSMLDMWQRVGRTRSVVLIAPDAPGKTWAAQDITAPRIAAMLDTVAAPRPIDRAHVYLFGHSAGASYAALLVNRGIGPWRAAALHGGSGSPDEYRPTPEAPPLRLYLGERDHIFSMEGAQAAAAALAAAGHDTELHLIPDHTHWFYEIGPNLAADVWGWFGSLNDPS